MKNCDKEIRFLQSVVNIDADKKIIDKYKNLRDKYFELEKEENLYNNYLEKINKEEYREKTSKELLSEINKITNDKRILFNEINELNTLKNKASKKFNKDEYENKIKEYLDNKKLLELKNNQKNNLYELKSDKLYTKVDRNKNIGNIDFIIKSINKTKKELK